MAFSSRFIKVPCHLVNTKLDDMDIEQEGIPSFIMINPFEISRYHPTCLNEADEFVETKIFFKDGGHMLLSMDINEFEKILNRHDPR